MSSPRDDDALSWGGDDDPTLDVGAKPAPEPEPEPESPAPARLPDGFTAVGKGSETLAAPAADPPTAVDPAVGVESETPAASSEGAEPEQMSSVMLLTLGVVAGIYLLYTIGRIVGGLRLAGTAQFLVSPVGYQAALWLAIAAPALWFVTSYVLTRGSKTWLRVVWLVGGLALLVPWPFIMVGAVGQ